MTLASPLTCDRGSLTQLISRNMSVFLSQSLEMWLRHSAIMLVPCLCFWAAIGSAAVLNIDQNFRQGDLEGLSGYTEAASIITTEAVSHGDQTSATTHKRLAERVVPEAQCGAPIDRKLIESCREAFDFLPNTGPVISFGQRVSMSQVDHVVPFLTVSCKWLLFYRLLARKMPASLPPSYWERVTNINIHPS